MNLHDIGRLLVGGGIVLALVGGLVLAAARLGLGRLPGDLSFGTGNLRVYVPLATSLVVSIVATVVLNLLWRK
ncbi:MAG TPA: DUF2905 domain-containing protein [Acidimicrobiales bacterium]|jgi:hypothetical protein|nr:DUF2905 domain-containing protein [Acidimicrobiales bacterium]